MTQQTLILSPTFSTRSGTLRVFGRLIVLLSVLTALEFAPAPVAARQLEVGVPRAQHPWGQFKIGAWKRVRTQTEVLDDKGRVVSSSSTETTTKLVDVDDSGYTLRVDVVVEVAGKRFASQPQVVRRGYAGEAEGQMVSVKRSNDGVVNVNGQKIPCQVREITVDTETGKRISTIYYSDKFSPYVLKRETACLDAEGKATDCNSQVDVVAVDMPCKVRSETKSASHVRIVSQQGKGSVLTLEVHVADIPGGVVSHSSKETDENGRIIRRSTLELLDYGPGNGDDADAQMVRKIYTRVRNRKATR